MIIAPFVTQAQNEFIEPVMGINPHDVPEDGLPADFNQRLGAILRLFPQAGPHAATENHDFRFHVVLGMAGGIFAGILAVSVSVAVSVPVQAKSGAAFFIGVHAVQRNAEDAGPGIIKQSPRAPNEVERRTVGPGHQHHRVGKGRKHPGCRKP